MNPDLEEVITSYQSEIANLFPKVANFLGVKIPITNKQWTGIDVEQRGVTDDGIKYFIHGYGIAMNDGNTIVDFDLGDKGQIDGFDSWRLWGFIEKNNIETSIKSESELKDLINEAEKNKELSYSGYILYYICK